MSVGHATKLAAVDTDTIVPLKAWLKVRMRMCADGRYLQNECHDTHATLDTLKKRRLDMDAAQARVNAGKADGPARLDAAQREHEAVLATATDKLEQLTEQHEHHRQCIIAYMKHTSAFADVCAQHLNEL